MNNADRLQIFHAQTDNVRMLNQAQTQIKRAINSALRKGDKTSSQVHTKLLALVFCAWVEANFSKLIHTPSGFTLNEIHQIKEVQQNNSLEAGWKKCIELGLRKISNAGKSNYIPNVRKRINRIVDEYVVAPSKIRNKIAHGQWKIALNKSNTAKNNDITKELDDLDSVVISIWFQGQEYLSNIVETLIESPNRAFHRDYWTEIAKLEDFLQRSKNWNIDEKTKRLQSKPITHSR